MNLRVADLPGMLRLLLVVFVQLVAGCATVYEGKLDPALFRRTPATPSMSVNTHIALVADAALKQFRYEHEKHSHRFVIPVGQILEAAVVAALSDEFGQFILQFPSSEVAIEANASVGRLTLVNSRLAKFELHDEYFPLIVPVPILAIVPIPTRQDVRLIVDWQVRDADGRLLWSRRYDSGDFTLPSNRTDSRDANSEHYFVHMAHEVAYTLMRQAARDLRSWAEAERLQERVL